MTSSSESQYSNFREFEQHVARIFHRSGWTVETPQQNQAGYDLVVKKGNIVAAVQVKWLRNNVQTPQVLQFVNFLETNEGRQFNCGFFITTKGYGGPALALIKSWGENPKILCGVAEENRIIWIFKEPPPPPPPLPKEKIYFGVFTCKGGVGKTTVSAHLAGAFALQGFNVALVDLDPEQNLQKLVGDGVYVPNRYGMGTTIEVFNDKTWDEDAGRNCKIVVFDCSPALERNKTEIIEKLDYCIIPTTLNPLGINKHGKVIQDTVKSLRQLNTKAHLFVLVNNFKDPRNPRRMKILKDTFLNAYEEISKTDSKFHCIDPEKVCIRSSDQLYYWGMHILESPDNPRSELAFNLIGGKSHPREDFIMLSDYIETEAGLGILRNK